MMFAKKIFPILVLSIAFLLTGCGDQNPLLGSWHMDTKDQSIYVRLGLSLATSGQNVSVLFDEEEMKVNYGRGLETFKVTYQKNQETKTWSFCLNDGKNCFPAVFQDEKKNNVTFPLYGINMSFVRQVD
ncbi:MAG: hypothetical protein LBE27_02505 [Deltaproteobacteria bacterium]|jgi:hypothetical protein|nr:hypothetical protein [Deltaproteobacteria bacterium]